MSTKHHTCSPRKRGLRKLVEAGMKKLNVAGGEPFLFPEFLGNICRYVKEDLHLESVSIVTNGSKVTEKWLRKYGSFVDIIAVPATPLTSRQISKLDVEVETTFNSFAGLRNGANSTVLNLR